MLIGSVPLLDHKQVRKTKGQKSLVFHLAKEDKTESLA
jgi:hypothetical protein